MCSNHTDSSNELTKQCHVPGLFNIKGLWFEVKKEKLKITEDSCIQLIEALFYKLGINNCQLIVDYLSEQFNWSTEEYEVEDVVDCKFDEELDEMVYLVKWKGYSEDQNTWEPRDNLLNCLHLVLPWDKQNVLNNFKLAYASKDYNCLKNNESIDGLSKKNLFKRQYYKQGRYIREKSRKHTRMQRDLGKKKLETFINYVINRYDCELIDKISDAVGKFGFENLINTSLHLKMKFSKNSKLYKDFKQELKNILKMWEDDMNSKSVNSPKLTVVNEVDFEGPPADFIYINERIPGAGVLLLKDPIIGCHCTDNDCSKDKKLCCMQRGKMRYNKKGLLRKLIQGTPIQECNSRCACDDTCPNRVVQKGRKYQLSIFRTSDGRGWGVKTMESIPMGAFVDEYIGEVITTDEAEKRGHLDNSEGLTYLFDLDYLGRDCAYTIDAKTYGNASRFINHSCNPNLSIFNVWIENLDKRLPRIALFASRDIRMGEELTFDYNIIIDENEDDDEEEEVDVDVCDDWTEIKRPKGCAISNEDDDDKMDISPHVQFMPLFNRINLADVGDDSDVSDVNVVSNCERNKDIMEESVEEGCDNNSNNSNNNNINNNNNNKSLKSSEGDDNADHFYDINNDKNSTDEIVSRVLRSQKNGVNNNNNKNDKNHNNKENNGENKRNNKRRASMSLLKENLMEYNNYPPPPSPPPSCSSSLENNSNNNNNNNNYSNHKNNNKLKDSKYKRLKVPCVCGAKNCRKFLY